MKVYLKVLPLLFVLGCDGASESDVGIQFDKASSYIEGGFKDFQSKWLLNTVVNQARVLEHEGQVDIPSDLSVAAKNALTAHAAAEVDKAVTAMDNADDTKIETEIFKLALKTVFLKAIIEQPQVGKFSFYPLYKTEVDNNVTDPLAKFTSLIGDANIDKMVESLASDAPFSINLKKDILTGLKTDLSVSGSTNPTDRSLRELQDDVQRWVGLSVPSVLDTPCQVANLSSPTFAELFCFAFQITGTFSEYTSSIDALLQGNFPDTFGISKTDLQEFRNDYVNADIAYLNEGIGSWLYPISLENIMNDLKENAKANDGSNADDFAKILDGFVDKVTRGHSQNPS